MNAGDQHSTSSYSFRCGISTKRLPRFYTFWCSLAVPTLRDDSQYSTKSASNTTRKPYMPTGRNLNDDFQTSDNDMAAAALLGAGSMADRLEFLGAPVKPTAMMSTSPKPLSVFTLTDCSTLMMMPVRLCHTNHALSAACADGTQSRWQTIASIVNTMMGTTIVALPYGMAITGVAMGMTIIGVMGAISCFTCLMLVQHGKGGGEFSAIVATHLGRCPQLIAWAMSTAIIAGAAIVYHILMQESVFQLVGAVAASAGDPAPEWWQRPYAALIPLAIYPVCNMKNMTVLVRMNSVGVFFLWYTMLFIVYHGASALHEGSGLAVQWGAAPATALPYRDDGKLIVNMGGTLDFGPLAGMMMLSFFIHNCIQPIIKHARTDTQTTDIIIA